MIVYDNRDFSSFEVDGAWLGRGGLARLVGAIPGVQILRRPLLLSRWRESEFCEFQLAGDVFVASSEDDGGRFLISSRGPASHATRETVRQAFCDARAWWGFA